REQSVTVDATIGRSLSRGSGVALTGLVTWYDTDILSGGSSTAYGVVGTYNRELSRRLSGAVSVSLSPGANSPGVSGHVIGSGNDDVVGAIVLALRYQL